MQLVADAIGVTQPAVFRHFPIKEAMWLAVMDWLEQRLVAIYSAADDSGEAGLVVLSRMFLEHVKLIATRPWPNLFSERAGARPQRSLVRSLRQPQPNLDVAAMAAA